MFPTRPMLVCEEGPPQGRGNPRTRLHWCRRRLRLPRTAPAGGTRAARAAPGTTSGTDLALRTARSRWGRPAATSLASCEHQLLHFRFPAPAVTSTKKLGELVTKRHHGNGTSPGPQLCCTFCACCFCCGAGGEVGVPHSVVGGGVGVGGRVNPAHSSEQSCRAKLGQSVPATHQPVGREVVPLDRRSQSCGQNVTLGGSDTPHLCRVEGSR